MKRLFVALPLEPSDQLLALLGSLQKRLSHERINWVKPENMHLTLKFLGETPGFRLQEINQALLEATAGASRFEYTFDKTGLFGSRHSPRVLWLGMQERNPALDHLTERVIDAMDRVGFQRDRQNFVPHLTLGRIHQLSDRKLFSTIVDSIPQQSYLQGTATEIVLYESFLLRQGPRYVVQERYGLG